MSGVVANSTRELTMWHLLLAAAEECGACSPSGGGVDAPAGTSFASFSTASGRTLTCTSTPRKPLLAAASDRHQAAAKQPPARSVVPSVGGSATPTPGRKVSRRLGEPQEPHECCKLDTRPR